MNLRHYLMIGLMLWCVVNAIGLLMLVGTNYPLIAYAFFLLWPTLLFFLSRYDSKSEDAHIRLLNRISSYIVAFSVIVAVLSPFLLLTDYFLSGTYNQNDLIEKVFGPSYGPMPGAQNIEI